MGHGAARGMCVQLLVVVRQYLDAGLTGHGRIDSDSPHRAVTSTATECGDASAGCGPGAGGNATRSSGGLADRGGRVEDSRTAPRALEPESARAPFEAARGGSTRGNAEHKQLRTSTPEPASAPRTSATPAKPRYAQRRFVKEICAERSNVFSRSLCEVQECMRSVNADDPFCRESREIAERRQIGTD